MNSQSANDVRNPSGESEIRALMANWAEALERKDVAGLTAAYVPDALLFDAIPPYKSEGVETIRDVWNGCLPHFPERFRSEHRDLVVTMTGEMAVVHGLHRVVPEDPNHPCGNTWLRITVCFRRVEGEWKVFHEHVSLPFNPMEGTVWNIADPDRLETPAYGESVEPNQE